MLKKVLFFGRKNDSNSIKVLSHLRKKSKIVQVIWSVNPEDKLKYKKILYKNYDYIFSFRSFFILKNNLIKKAKFAAINFHPGPPEYRGTGCLNYAMYDNAKYYGVTTHLMDKKIDYGKIINVKRFKILKKNSVESLLNKAHKMLFEQAIELINLLSKNHNNLSKLIYKSRKERWSKKITKRKELDEFYNIKKNISHKELIKRIRACYMHDSFKPYFMLHNFKFTLMSPSYEKTGKIPKYKMYFDLPLDLKKKYERNKNRK